MKRFIDIILSVIGLIILLPLFIITAILLKISGPGPVFFIHKRIGKNFEPFNLYKFRTMKSDSEGQGPAFTAEDDPRITSVGKFLRKTKVDELPQLLNVLRGDMSIVGPRPEVEKYVNLNREDYSDILKIRPGITDISSITYIDEEAVLKGKKDPEEYYLNVLLPEKLRLAKEYARKASIFYDMKLILLTLFKIFYRKEAVLRLMEKATPYRKPIVIGIQMAVFVLANYSAFLIRFDGSLPASELDRFLDYIILLCLIRTVLLFVFSLEKGFWRYTSVRDVVNITAATTVGSLIFLIIVRYVLRDIAYPRSVYVIDWFLNILLLSGVRMFRRMHERADDRKTLRKRIIVIGAGDAAEMLLRDIQRSSFYPYKVIGFIDDDPKKKGLMLRGIPVLGTRKDIKDVIERELPDEFLLAIPSATRDEFENIISDLRQYALPIKTVPSIWSMLSGRELIGSIKPVNPEDILFRAPVSRISTADKGFFNRKTVLITGAGGSIGSELSRQVFSCIPGNLILLERHEENLYNIDLELRSLKSHSNTKISSVIGDILDEKRLDEVLRNYRPNIILHAAAYKHVPLMEENPYESFKTNVIGTKVLAEKSRVYGVERFIFISTDKAVNPVNVMGMTKKLAEQIIRCFSGEGSSPTKYMIVRFGNVLESSGSVVPLFIEQIKRGGPVTVTHPDVTRYFMTIPEAVNLVLQAATMGKGGEVFVLDMGMPVKIIDMAKRMISLYGYRPGVDIDISFIGLRAGEKLYEELFNDDESVEKTSHPKINIAIPGRKVETSILETLKAFNDPSYFSNSEDLTNIFYKLNK